MKKNSKKFWFLGNYHYLCTRALYEARTFYLLKFLCRTTTSKETKRVNMIPIDAALLV